MPESITITRTHRQRLGTLLQAAQAHGMERREHLLTLEEELERARAVEPHELSHDVVTMESTVKLRDLDTGEVETYTIVYPERADATRNRISVLAPIATAVLGCRAGEVVEVTVPSGLRRIRVEAVVFQPERAGEHD